MFTYAYYSTDKSKIVLEQFADGHKRILFESKEMLPLKKDDKIKVKQIDNYYHIYLNDEFIDTCIDI